MAATNANATNYFSPARWVVSTVAGQGTHTTITAATTAASAGDTIVLMDYVATEDVAMKTGVNYSAFMGASNEPTSKVTGKWTYSGAGTVSISNIELITNSDNFLSVTGNSASIVNINRCFLKCSNNTGIAFSSSSASAEITIEDCDGDIGTTGIALYAHSSAGTLNLYDSNFTNTGLTVTSCTNSAGSTNIFFCFIQFPITNSSTNSLQIYNCFISQSANTTALTIGSTTSGILNSTIGSGSASAISISGSFSVVLCDISSNNTNAITGAGTINYGNLTFSGSSNLINTTTQAAYISRPGITRSAHQPAFLAYLPSNDANVTGDATAYTLGGTTALTKVFDQNGDFNTNGTFTAPYTGRYLFNSTFRVATLGAGHTLGFVLLNATSRTARTADLNAAATRDSNNNIVFGSSTLIDMTAGDTCTTSVTISNSTKTVQINGAASLTSFFSGNLVC